MCLLVSEGLPDYGAVGLLGFGSQVGPGKLSATEFIFKDAVIRIISLIPFLVFVFGTWGRYFVEYFVLVFIGEIHL